MPALEPKTATCPCGNGVRIPVIPAWDGKGQQYDVCNPVCSKCGRRANGGNYAKGTVSSWISRRQLAESQREYERQSFESDNNEFYGRGNW